MEYIQVLNSRKFLDSKKLISFLYFFVGISTGLFIFRKIIKIYDLLYQLSIVFLALRSIYLCLTCNKKLSSWPFVLRDLTLLLCLTFALCFSEKFFFENLVGMTSLLLIGIIAIKKPEEYESTAYLKGLKITFILNFIFAIIQIIFLIKYKVNIFYSFGYAIGLYDTFDEQAAMNATRVTGLIWDPYVIGMYCALGFFMFKKKIVKFAIIVILFYSGSRSGQLALFMAILYYYFPDIKKYIKKDYLFLPLFFLLITIFLVCVPLIIDVLDFDRGFNRKSAGWRRIEYITKIPEVWANDENPCLPLFGGAPMFTGGRYMFTDVPSMAKSMEKTPKWGVETDWFGILIGRGIFGFLMYLILYLNIFFSKRERINKTLAFAVFIGGVGYIYDTAIFSMLVVYFAGNSVKSLVKDK